MNKLFLKAKEKTISFFKEEDAQGLTEYILLAVIVVAIAVTFKTQIGDIIKKKLLDLNTSVDKVTSDGI